MAQHTIEPKVNFDEYFKGLASQGLDFHQALGELIDNALSARTFTPLGAHGLDPSTAVVEVLVDELSDGTVTAVVADSGVGMTVDDLQHHVFGLGQRGRTKTSKGSMNEHGFGLKNALAVLTGGDTSRFSLVTRSADPTDKLKPDQFLVVRGPFASSMSADDSGSRVNDWSPDLQVLSGSPTGTRIEVNSDVGFFRTVWKHRGTSSKFAAYVTRLAEHIGVVYRNFIDSGDKIFLSWRSHGGTWTGPVPIIAIHPPYDSSSSATLKISAGGKTHEILYTYGKNDYQIRDEGPDASKVVQGEGDPGYPYPLRIYYQGSNSRSGADIIVRRRVIQTEVWKDIWPDLSHTVEYNKWLAEIELDEDFRTTNNKSGMDPNGGAWQELLNTIGHKDSKYSPAKTSPEQTERSLEEQLVEFLKVQVGTNGHVAQQVGTWSGATTADVVVYAANKKSINQIYEIKVGRGTVDDVYQLVCQWDGFERDGFRPGEGILYCSSYDHKPESAIDALNKRTAGGKAMYNLRIQKHAVLATASVGGMQSKLSVPKKATGKKLFARNSAKKTATAASAQKAPVNKAVAKKVVVKKSAKRSAQMP